MTYDPVFVYRDYKKSKVAQCKYWSDKGQCWKRVFHSWEIPEDEWIKMSKDHRISILRELSCNPAFLSMRTYHIVLNEG